jgi:hypothetical protein
MAEAAEKEHSVIYPNYGGMRMAQEIKSGAREVSPADVRAREIEERMTDDERFSLLVSVMGENPVVPLARDERIPEGTPMSAGYTPGVPRLGIPALLMSDASMGVTTPGYANREGDAATALPASIVLGSSFSPELARTGGRMIGREARSRGFNVMLAGGINLARDPRNGRTFEYLSEDPLLSAVLCAEAVNGIQGEGVISTVKHYSLNCNEIMRHWLDAVIDPAAHRESDLLAFEIAIERSQPGSVMTGYNKVNGDYAGGNAVLLNDVLKGVGLLERFHERLVLPVQRVDLDAALLVEPLEGEVPARSRAPVGHHPARVAPRAPRQAAQGTAHRHGAADPPLDVCGGHRRLGAGARDRHGEA